VLCKKVKPLAYIAIVDINQEITAEGDSECGKRHERGNLSGVRS